MGIQPVIITSLVQSGLIPALLFRVGTGPDLDIRLNVLVVHFLYQILLKVSFVQPRYKRNISLISVLPKPVFYLRGVLPKIDEEEESVSDSQFELNASRNLARVMSDIAKLEIREPIKIISSSVDSYQNLKLISDTMHAHGVTKMLLQSLGYFKITIKFIFYESDSIFLRELLLLHVIRRVADDVELVKEALLSLSCLKFSSIQAEIFQLDVVSRICHLTETKHECFYGGLALICDVRF